VSLAPCCCCCVAAFARVLRTRVFSDGSAWARDGGDWILSSRSSSSSFYIAASMSDALHAGQV
jgi:hypothetical protein